MAPAKRTPRKAPAAQFTEPTKKAPARKPGARATYTDEQRADARRVFEAEGLAAAVDATGIARATISSWARRNEWTPCTTEASQKARERTEAGRQTLAQRKLDLAGRIVDEATAVLAQLRAPSVERRIVTLNGRIVLQVDDDGMPDFASGWTVAEVQRDTPTYAEQQKIATTFAILVDKLQVLTGGVTQRVGIEDDREVQAVAADVLRLIPGGRAEAAG